jgi:hypothetical protein
MAMSMMLRHVALGRRMRLFNSYGRYTGSDGSLNMVAVASENGVAER